MNTIIIEEKDIDVTQMYKSRDAEQLLCIGHETLKQWIKSNKIKGEKIKNRYYIKGSVLIDFISDNRDALNKRKKINEEKILRYKEYQKEEWNKKQKYRDYQNTKSGAFINLSDLPEELTEWHDTPEELTEWHDTQCEYICGNFEYDVREETLTDILISKLGGPCDYNFFSEDADDDINTAIENGECKWFSKAFVKINDNGNIFIRKWLFEKDEFFENGEIKQIDKKED